MRPDEIAAGRGGDCRADGPRKLFDALYAGIAGRQDVHVRRRGGLETVGQALETCVDDQRKGEIRIGRRVGRAQLQPAVLPLRGGDADEL